MIAMMMMVMMTFLRIDFRSHKNLFIPLLLPLPAPVFSSLWTNQCHIRDNDFFPSASDNKGMRRYHFPTYLKVLGGDKERPIPNQAINQAQFKGQCHLLEHLLEQKPQWCLDALRHLTSFFL